MLRELSETFSRVARGDTLNDTVLRRFVRVARDLGATAVPLLCRKLVDPDERQSSWAYHLLGRSLGARAEAGVRRNASYRERAVAALHAMAATGRSVTTRRRWSSRCSPSSGRAPAAVSLRDAGALRRRSVQQLVGRLVEPADVAHAADLLLEQVLDHELAAFVVEMVDVCGAAIAPLIDELLLRDDLSTRHRGGDRRAAGGLSATRPLAAPPRGRLVFRGEGPRRALRGGRGAARAPTRRRRRRLGVARPGRADHRQRDARRGHLRRRRRRPARHPQAVRRPDGEGYRLSASTVADVAHPIVEAARRTRAAGERLPRAFFLGRDLVGLYDEHARPPAPLTALIRRPSPHDDLGPGVGALSEAGDAAARTPAARGVRRRRAGARRGAHLPGRVPPRPRPPGPRRRRGGSPLRRRRAPRARRPAAPLEPRRRRQATRQAGACYLALLQFKRLADPADTSTRMNNARGFMRAATSAWRSASTPAHRRGRGARRGALRIARSRTCKPAAARTRSPASRRSSSSSRPTTRRGGTSARPMPFSNAATIAEAALRKALEYRPDYELAQRNLERARGVDLGANTFG